MKNIEKCKSQELRRQGKSVKFIARELKVSSGSVSRWVKDIELTEGQKSLLKNNGANKGAEKTKENALLKRKSFQLEGRKLAKKKEPLHIAGCMLYWGEGGKRRNEVCLANSDPNLLKFFKSFLDFYFNLEDSDYTINCKLWTDKHSQSKIERYWLDFLELPESCLRSSTVNYQSRHSKNKRRGYLEYGCCTLNVCKSQVIQSIYGSIQEYGGFVNDNWIS